MSLVGVKRRPLIIPPPRGFGAWAGQQLRARDPTPRGASDVTEIATGAWADVAPMTYAALLYIPHDLTDGGGGYIIADRSSGAQLILGIFSDPPDGFRLGFFRDYSGTNMDCNGTSGELPNRQWHMIFAIDGGAGVAPLHFFGALGEDCIESGYGFGQTAGTGSIVAATHWDFLSRGHGSGSPYDGPIAWVGVFVGVALTQDQCSEITRLWKMPHNAMPAPEFSPGCTLGRS